MKQGTMNILFFILKTKLLLKRVFGKEGSADFPGWQAFF